MPKASLVKASPKILRKTAITWWADSGINQAQAAEWAAHTEEVARIYYASRASTTFAREVALLERGMVPSEMPDLHRQGRGLPPSSR